MISWACWDLVAGVHRLYLLPANCTSTKGPGAGIQNDSLRCVILTSLRRPEAAPRVPRERLPGCAAHSRGASTTFLSYGLRDERRYPYLCEALLGICLVKPHPRKRVLRLCLRDESGYLFELLVGMPKVLLTTLLPYEYVVILLQCNERFHKCIFTARSAVSLRFLWAHLW